MNIKNCNFYNVGKKIHPITSIDFSIRNFKKEFGTPARGIILLLARDSANMRTIIVLYLLCKSDCSTVDIQYSITNDLIKGELSKYDE
jgi:hypothetical protein